MQLDEQGEEHMVSEDEDSEEEYDDNDDEKDNDKKEKREPYNDQVGLQLKLNQMKLNLDWIETLDVTSDTKNLQGATGNDAVGKEKNVKDDFQREMLFYCQAQEALKEALGKLQCLGIATVRPEDYFAEMVKSDVHMQKVRRKLLEKKDGMELSEKAKRQRELKKMGKTIQQNVLQKRQVEKKKMLNEVDRMKKGKSQKLYGDGGGDSFNISTDAKSQIGNKRKRKDEKFGFGGRKRKLKKNSVDSSAEMSGYKSHIHGKARNDPVGKGNRKTRGKTVNHNKGKKRGKT